VPSLFYIRLIALTAGTLVYLFLLALILGHRRPRLLERLLFFLNLSLFLIYAGALLEMNSAIEYGSPPDTTRLFYSLLEGVGIAFLPALLVHAHFVYIRAVKRRAISRFCWAVVGLLYVYPFVHVLGSLFIVRHLPGYSSFSVLLVWFTAGGKLLLLPAVLVCLAADCVIAKSSNDPIERRFFIWLGALCVLIFASLALREGFATLRPMVGGGNATAIALLGVLPGALLLYYAVLRNFLEFGAQRNLMYALPVTFLALLYLALVRRVSGWLEPVLPPEATASVLLFVLIFLFEPLERLIGPVLQRKFREGMGAVQRLTVELQQEARQGNVAHLAAEAEKRIREAYALAAVRLSIPRDAAICGSFVPS